MTEEEAHRTIGEIVKRARENSARVKTAPKRIVTTKTQGKCGKSPAVDIGAVHRIGDASVAVDGSFPRVVPIALCFV